MCALCLKQVMRLDSIPLDKTYWTGEGYLVDRPIVTSCGIFEYLQEDGNVRRELRLPENVFEEDSLASYEGKPIIITHDAGFVDKDNVEEEQIGTILSRGYQDGDNVRAKIVIHNTDALRCGLRELSLGYNLTLDETPGVWNGQPYDAIQKNIRINHLALVDNARAGEQARLNIDGKEKKITLKGGKVMAKTKKTRMDGADLTPEQLQEAVAAYVASHQQGQGDGVVPAALEPKTDTDTEPAAISSEEKVQMVKDRRDSRRDQEVAPATTEEAQAVIAQQDEDIDTLLSVIEAMEAKQDFDEADDDVNADEDGEEKTDEEDKNAGGTMNADSIDRIVRTSVALARIGDSLHLDGLESMSIIEAKKAIIRKVKPKMRLDGRSRAYIDAAFDLAAEEATARKDTNFQRRQIFNADGRSGAVNAGGSEKTAAEKAREKMISKRMGGNE